MGHAPVRPIAKTAAFRCPAERRDADDIGFGRGNGPDTHRRDRGASDAGTAPPDYPRRRDPLAHHPVPRGCQARQRPENTALRRRRPAARNLCLPAKGRYRAYLRWDPAAGRCRPRDKYEQGSCAGSRARYHPGKRHAQDLAGSIRMYGASTQRAEAALRQCSSGLDKLRGASADRFETQARNCAISKRLKRRDLIARYCK